MMLDPHQRKEFAHWFRKAYEMRHRAGRDEQSSRIPYPEQTPSRRWALSNADHRWLKRLKIKAE